MTADATSTKQIVLNESTFWLAANALGIAIYLAFESWILAPRSVEDALNGIDEIDYWIEFDLPVLAVFLVLNIIWLIRIWRRSQASTKWPFRIWLLTCLAWGIGLIYHGFVIKILLIVVAMIDGQAWK
jgi:hypothetical protein